MSSPSLLAATGLDKRYSHEAVAVLESAALELAARELVVVTGPSGSGKSTLLAILAGLDDPDGGEVTLRGTLGTPVPWGQLAFVPQALGLLDDLPVDEAIGLPLRLAGRSRREEDDAVDRVLHRLGRASVRHHLPWQLSLGEQQRTAIGRAVVVEPDVVLLDEPTAHQDNTSTQRILDVLCDLVFRGAAALVATHDPAVVEVADRHLRLVGGTLVAA